MNDNNLQALQRVSLSHIIELSVQKTYHDLTVLAELLHRKTDHERKVEIVNFAERTRQLFIRLLALVKWAGGASKVEQCIDIVSFLNDQAGLFTNTADNMANIARNTLVQARLPSFQLPCAVEVLTLGTYSRMPTCVRDRIVPPDPITLEEKKNTLARLDHIIEQRLSTTSIHPSMRNLKIEFGRVTFHVENEFDLKLTLLGDNPNLPWCVLGLDLLVEDSDMGEGKDVVHPAHVKGIERAIQRKMNESQTPLVDIFAKLHNFCLSLQIEVLHDQIDRLIRERLSSSIKIKEHDPGKELSITYWSGKNVLKIQTDQSDLSKPLKLTHQPELNMDSNYPDQDRETIFKPGDVSIEQIITDTIQKRAYIKLNQLSQELKEKQYGRCTISGIPSLLHVCCLDPCAASEELIISIDLNGSYLAHVPQYEKSCPLADNIQESLNSNRSKLGTYFDQLKIWLAKKRCLRTIDYLSVTATESLPLCSKANHAKLDDKVPRLFFQFNKYNHYYLMAEFFTSEVNPYSLDTRYSLLVTELAPNLTGDGLDILEDETSVETVKRDLVVVENILSLNASDIIATNYCYDSALHDKSVICGSNNVTTKRDFLKNYREANLQRPSTTSNGTEKKSGSNEYVVQKPPVSLIAELPQLVSFCEERLAHLVLEKELRNRNVQYQVTHSETSGYAYCITFSQVPGFKSNGYSNALRQDTSVMTVCLHEKPQSSKIWQCSYIFKNCPIATQATKEQSPRRFVFTPYESPLLNQQMVSMFIDDIHLDWACMANLYDVVKEFARDIKSDPKILETVILKSFNYKRLVILYGPKRNYSVSLLWRPAGRNFHLVFSVVGGTPFKINPHSCMSTHFRHEFNQHKSIKVLINTLNVTLEPLETIQQFPVYPYLGSMNSRPLMPATSFCIIPLSTTKFKLIWRHFHGVAIKILSDGTLSLQDASQSKFHRKRIVDDLNPICHFDALVCRQQKSTSYTLSLEEFKKIFKPDRVEQHLGMCYMIYNIKNRQPPVSLIGDNVVGVSGELLQYRFTMDPSRIVVQMKATPKIMEDWRPEDISALERYFELKIASSPYKADSFSGFLRLLINSNKNFITDFIQIIKMELYPNHLDPSILWNVALCNVIPTGTPFILAGYSSICPLKAVTLFVLQLTKRGVYGNDNPLFYLPLSYDPSLNSLDAYIPTKMDNVVNNNLSYLRAVDQHLKRFCDQFKASQNQGCVIYHAIRQLVMLPNPFMFYL